MIIKMHVLFCVLRELFYYIFGQKRRRSVVEIGQGTLPDPEKFCEQNTTTPLIYINGAYNLQFSQEVRVGTGDCLCKKVLFNLLPLMNAEINAEYLFQKILGGNIQVGEYKELADGIHPSWSKDRPIRFVCHSYGCDVLLKLVDLLHAKGCNPGEMISMVYLVNPHFAAVESNYNNWHEKLTYVYLNLCDIYHSSRLVSLIYTPRDCVLSANRIKTTSMELPERGTYEKLSKALKDHQVGGRLFFDVTSERYCSLTEARLFLTRMGVQHTFVVGNIQVTVGSLYTSFATSVFYLVSLGCLQQTNAAARTRLDNLTPFDHVFDGMCLYDYKECLKNNVKIVDGVGHLNFTSPW